jgi:hypothetical protein
MNIVEIESHVNRCGGCYIRPDFPYPNFYSSIMQLVDK